MAIVKDHPLRFELANELHARPFPVISAPGHAVFLALRCPGDRAERDRAAEQAHLIALLDRFGAQHPKPDATHYFGDLGAFRLKWESHTEFVTYTAIMDGADQARPFDPSAFEVFPADWLADAPGERVTSALIRMDRMPAAETVEERVKAWFVPESLAVSSILEGAAVIAGDFRIDSAGHMRLAIFVAEDTGPARVGRVLQRLCEIETYKAMSMLGFARARRLSPELGALDAQFADLMQAITRQSEPAAQTLGRILELTAELEAMVSETAYRFSATKAYAALVAERVAVLREARFAGRQTFHEFMMRRFDPAMRTVLATQARLENLADRAARSGTLLRTRVDVDRSAQNQALLESMDRRADLQLRLQETVEGLSVVAISYYAVNLASYLLAPFAASVGVQKSWLSALLVLPILGAVFWMLRRVKKRLH